MATADIRLVPGMVYKHFTARDVVSRWDVLEVSQRATAPNERGYSRRVHNLSPNPSPC